MSHKTYVCKICQASVTKPQSFAYKDGRACRTHPEAQQAHEQATVQQASIRDKAKRNRFSPFRQGGERAERPFEELIPGFRNPNQYCWHCLKDGIYEKEVYFRILVNMSKAKLEGLGPINPFDPESPHYKLTRKDLGQNLILKRFIVEKIPEWKLKQLVSNRDLVMVAQIAGLVVLCTDCSAEFGFDWYFDRPKVEDISIEDMLALGQVGEKIGDHFAMREILNRIFHKEPKETF